MQDDVQAIRFARDGFRATLAAVRAPDADRRRDQPDIPHDARLHDRLHLAPRLPLLLHLVLVADGRLRRMVRLRLRLAGKRRPQD